MIYLRSLGQFGVHTPESLARIVDAKLQPLAGAVLTFESLDMGAESDADGMVRMAFDLRNDGRYALNVALDGYATKFFGADIDADAPNDLGQRGYVERTEEKRNFYLGFKGFRDFGADTRSLQ